MIVSANQPYFSPFPGFFSKAYHSDTLIVLDDVQFPQGTTWISRNRFKNDHGTFWMTIPVWKKGLGLQPINQVRICYEGRWTRKHMESIKTAYGNAPYLSDHLRFIEDMFSGRFEKLIDLNMAIIRYLLQCLRIKTNLILLSELGIKGRSTALLIEICKAVGATTFLAQKQVAKFLDPEIFRENRITFRSFPYTPPVYPQLWGDFLANLSTFDLVFNCGPKAQGILLGNGSVHNSLHP
ncbi:MAG: WbqC-like protein family protein [Syntrophorhabdus sp. PtaU1.Bin153]|nr:MAG: WbqC-like protein family protein [Syntrophorhabdus sp. PtaU1.Bin153]